MLFFDQASGISISFVSGTDFPDLMSNSNTLSNAAESEFPIPITGFKDSVSSKILLLIRGEEKFLVNEKTKLQTDYKHIEELAREKYRMSKKGERVFKVIEKENNN